MPFGIGAPEILIVLAIVLLLFGGRKLPELARGTGRALRIFKSEVKEIDGDKDKNSAAEASAEIVADDEADGSSQPKDLA